MTTAAKQLEAEIKSGPDDWRAADLIHRYREEFGSPNISLVVEKFLASKDEAIVTASLKACAVKGYSSDAFWDRVVELACGVDWDEDGTVRIEAMYALVRFDGDEALLSEVVRLALQSEDPAVRDSLADLAQRRAGISHREMGGWRKTDGMALQRMPEKAKLWVARLSGGQQQ